MQALLSIGCTARVVAFNNVSQQTPREQEVKYLIYSMAKHNSEFKIKKEPWDIFLHGKQSLGFNFDIIGVF